MVAAVLDFLSFLSISWTPYNEVCLFYFILSYALVKFIETTVKVFFYVYEVIMNYVQYLKIDQLFSILFPSVKSV